MVGDVTRILTAVNTHVYVRCALISGESLAIRFLSRRRELSEVEWDITVSANLMEYSISEIMTIIMTSRTCTVRIDYERGIIYPTEQRRDRRIF